jgi:ubiquinone biosynthesis protein COQ4
MTAVAAFPVPPLPTRLRTAGRALFRLMRDPSQLERVFEIGIALNAGRLPEIIARVEAEPEGRRILQLRPSIDSRHVDFDALEKLPDGTLGREYVRFLRDNGIHPDVFTAPDLPDPRAAYIFQRIRQTHDLWHVLTGYKPDVDGEILLQAFTFAQLRAPSAFALSVTGAVRFGWRRRGFYRDFARAYRRGKATRRLATFYWEEHWDEPLSSLRAELACPPYQA